MSSNPSDRQTGIEGSMTDEPMKRAGGHVALLVIEGVVALFAGVMVLGTQLNSPGCGDSTACLEQISAIAKVGLSLIVGVLILSVIGVVLLRRVGRRAVIPPIVGIALLIGIVVVSSLLVQSLVPAY